ncbi:MAG: hypothetical protein PHY15_06935 [Eubacteriales bacterium]|nr:hypothetical protein [Eubacteriales bacterium]MDD4475403.1 hypothetical protein [Eubacteriales bacterium]
MTIKKLAVLILTLVLFSTLFSCENEKNNMNLPKALKEDEVIILLDDVDFTFYESMSFMRFIQFDIISQKEIRDDYSLNLDINTPYKLTIEEKPEQEESGLEFEFPYYVFQSYQNVDWKEMYSLHLLNEKSIEEEYKQYEPYVEYMNLYKDSYSKVKASDLPVLYRYTASIVFNMPDNIDENEEIEELKFEINGKEYKKKVNIKIDYTTKSIYKVESILQRALAQSERLIIPNSEGKMVVDNFPVECKSDIEITDFYVLNNDVEIKELTINSSINNGANINQKWVKGKIIAFPEGTNFNIKVTFTDKNFIDKMNYSAKVYLVLEYNSGEGKEECTYFEIVFTTKLNEYEILGVMYDQTTIKSYYYDYYSKISGR